MRKLAVLFMLVLGIFVSACTFINRNDSYDLKKEALEGTLAQDNDFSLKSKSKTLLEWEVVIDIDGLASDIDYTFPNGITRRYTLKEYVLFLEDGFNPAKILELPGNLQWDLWIPKNALPSSLITEKAKNLSQEIESETYVWYDLIKGKTMGGSYSYTEEHFLDYGDRTHIFLTDNWVLFLGDEFPGEGEQLLEKLKGKMNKAYLLLEKAFSENAQNIDEGQFGDWPSEEIEKRLARLKKSIDTTTYVTKLGKYVVFLGPYTVLWDETTDEVYFFFSYPYGGAILQADFNDEVLFIPMYFTE